MLCKKGPISASHISTLLSPCHIRLKGCQGDWGVYLGQNTCKEKAVSGIPGRNKQ